VSLHNILFGVIRTIHKSCTYLYLISTAEEALNKLGLDQCKVTNLPENF